MFHTHGQIQPHPGPRPDLCQRLATGLRLAVLSAWMCVLQAADSTTVFSEIHYHPAQQESSREWIELHNLMSVRMDLSRWRLAGGVTFIFPEGTVIPGGGHLVVALQPEALRSIGVSNVVGPFQGRLSNAGERLELRNNNNRLMDAVDYGVDRPWPVAPDGHGPSLAKRTPLLPSDPASSWRPSSQAGGTPGRPNFPVRVGRPPLPLVPTTASWSIAPLGSTPPGDWSTRETAPVDWTRGIAPLHGGDVTPPPPVLGPIASLFGTGLSETRTPLPPGTADPHYRVLASAHSTQPPLPAPALVIEGQPAWLANDTASQWLGPVNPGEESVAAGSYRYATDFFLTSTEAASAEIRVRMAADNRVNSLILNGVPTGRSWIGFQQWSPEIPIRSGFREGTNTLEFVWANDGDSPNPAGLRVEAAGTALSGSDPSGRLAWVPRTVHLRTSFLCDAIDTGSRVHLTGSVNDGAVFRLNGAEVHRVNLPTGTLSPSTPALVATRDQGQSIDHWIPPGVLRPGLNILAVEIHQAEDGLSGAWLEASLMAFEVPEDGLSNLVLNEVSGPGPGFFLELMNPGTEDQGLDPWAIRRSGSAEGLYRFPAGMRLAPGRQLLLTRESLGWTPVAGDHLSLVWATDDRVADTLVVQDRPEGRFPDGSPNWFRVTRITPGSSNEVALERAIVINEILYQPPDGAPPNTWVELFNREDRVVDLTGWTLDGGIRFTFPSGTRLLPGAHLVVASDPTALRAEVPEIPILGPFSGRLSRSGETLLLRDALGNPVDSVTYADSGRWPWEADGGGSSLELRDPRADNASPEAWEASVEPTPSEWQAVSYRGIATPSSGPTLWKEFIVGLLDQGECLIDDLRVVESPDSGSPVELLKNGSFETGTSSWRFLGNHRHSRVIEDPGQPGNKVLHLVATGPTEHMHNHLETTVVGNRSLVNGRAYEVSFRARWLKGSPQLHTRLYFNRIARTTVLPARRLVGTPGRTNSTRVPNLGPTFLSLTHTPAVPDAGAPITIQAAVEDPQGVATARVLWSVNGGTWQSKPMTVRTSGTIAAEIPGAPQGSVVQFYVEASDTLGVNSWSPARGPASRALIPVADGRAGSGPLHNLRVTMTASDSAFLYAATNLMSNERLGATVISDESEIVYDVGVHLQGSQRGRPEAGRVGLTLRFPPDRLFRGIHRTVSIDRSGGYTGVGGDQDEIVLKHALQHAGGLPGMYDDLVRIIPPRTDLTGPALLILAKYGDVFLDSQYENGSEGDLFKLELIYFPLTTTGGAEGFKLPQPDDIVPVRYSDLGTDPEAYRWFFLRENNRDRDDFGGVAGLWKTLTLSGTALEEASERVMDVDTWLRAIAFQSLFGMVDTYPYDNPHNFMIYFRPEDGRALPFLWDMDFNFGAGATSPLNRTGANLSRLVALPGNLRRYYGHMLDMVNSTFNVAYLGPWIDHYGGLVGQNFGGIRGFVDARSKFVASQIPARVPFQVTQPTPENRAVATPQIMLQGRSWFDVHSVWIEGPDRTNQVRWPNLTTWTCDLSLLLGPNRVRVRTVDFHGISTVRDEFVVFATVPGGGVDEDQDGLPDLWERQQGFAPETMAGTDDPDQDGHPNRAEYEAGTDPRDPASRLELIPNLGSTPLRYRFKAVAGRSYSLVVDDRLPGSTWSSVTQISAGMTDRVVDLELPPSPDARPRFYRIVTPQIP